MERFFIQGGKALRGELKIDTAKNSILPLMAASIMVEGVTTFQNVTRYSDVLVMSKIIESLGAVVSWDGDSLIIDSRELSGSSVLNELAGKLRASVFLLGPVLARQKTAKIAYPGGCEIGLRPIDIHLDGLKALGAKVIDKNGYIYASADKMRGGDYALRFASVGATENIMMAAVLTKGQTRIYNAAKEPEIVDLACYLNKCGAKISGAGSSVITIEGVKKLSRSVKFRPLGDRIIAGTMLLACAACGGEITLKNAKAEHNEALIAKLSQSACQFDIKSDKIKMRSYGRLKSFGSVETATYPGIPTDLQPQIVALQCVSDGCCMIVENLFESRFKHAAELMKMGADITLKNNVCLTRGRDKLYGAEVKASDLRGGAALVIAGLAAEGYTTVEGVEFIDRGYYELEKQICLLGGDMKREKI